MEFIEVIVHKCSKKRCFRNIGGTYKKTPAAKYNFRQQGVIWLLCLQALKPKNAQENCAFDVLDVHMYALCIFMFVFFQDEVRSNKIQGPYRFWLSLFPKGFIKFTLFYIYQSLDRKSPYKKLYEKSYGCNAELFLQGH